MAVVARIPYLNRIRGQGVAIVPSSQVSSLPAGFLRDQLPSKVLRFQSGWTIVAGFNDKIDWTRAGTRVATLTPGTYGNGAEMAAEVQARMQAADGGATYTVTYSTSTFKFTISCSAAIQILWLTGVNTSTSCGKDLGFDTSADTGSSTAHAAANTSYQSRHFIKADLGSALSTAVGIVWNHNAGSGGIFTHQANSADSWFGPTVSQVLAGDDAIRIGYFGTQTLRYRRLVIEDVQNTLGYSELGVWWDGPYIQPSVLYSQAFRDDPQELSQIAYGTHGAHFVDIRAIRKVLFLEWKEAPPADLVLLQQLEAATPSGTNFFFSFNAVDDPDDTLYGFRLDAMPKQYEPGIYWTPSFHFAAALE